MDLARLEFQAEATYVFGQVAQYGAATNILHLDGVSTVPGTKTGWYWAKSRYPIDYAMTWFGSEPDNHQGDQKCLCIVKDSGMVGYGDIACYANAWSIAPQGPQPYLCQVWHENFIHRIVNNQQIVTGK